MNKLIYILIYTKQIQIFRLHIEIFLMVVCLLECSGLIPDIDLQGTEYMNNGVVIFQFNCSSNIGFKGCTVEGILGNRTHDNIRYAHDECFHKDGKCTLECCECSSDCKFFIWNVKILNKTVNNSFGCQSRIESNGITYKAMVFIRHNSNGFTVSNKTVDPIKGYKPIITIRPSISDVPCGTKIGWKISTLIILPVLLVVSIVLCIITCRYVRLRKYKDKVTKERTKSMSSDQNEKSQDTEPPSVKVLSVADTEQPHSTTASSWEIESNRSTDSEMLNLSDADTEQPHSTTASPLEIESSHSTVVKNPPPMRPRPEMSGKKFAERWKEQKHKSNVTDLKKRHSLGHLDSKSLTCFRNQNYTESEDEQLISKQPENGEDMDMLVDQNSPDFENKRRSFSQ